MHACMHACSAVASLSVGEKRITEPHIFASIFQSHMFLSVPDYNILKMLKLTKDYQSQTLTALIHQEDVQDYFFSISSSLSLSCSFFHFTKYIAQCTNLCTDFFFSAKRDPVKKSAKKPDDTSSHGIRSVVPILRKLDLPVRRVQTSALTIVSIHITVIVLGIQQLGIYFHTQTQCENYIVLLSARLLLPPAGLRIKSVVLVLFSLHYELADCA